MLPDGVTSSIALPAPLSDPDTRVTSALVDYEMGGIALHDPTQGSQYQPWMLYMEGLQVKIRPVGNDTPVTDIIAYLGITELALAFDQNMRYAVALAKGGLVGLKWYDSLSLSYVMTWFSEGHSPRLTLDDKRPSQANRSDVLFAYIRNNALYYRQQRDRFQIERLLRANLIPGTKLRAIGLGKNLRLQFELVIV